MCDHGEPCILLTFYQYLLDPLSLPSPDSQRNDDFGEVKRRAGESDGGGGGREDCVIQTQVRAIHLSWFFSYFFYEFTLLIEPHIVEYYIFRL